MANWNNSDFDLGTLRIRFTLGEEYCLNQELLLESDQLEWNYFPLRNGVN